MIDTLVSIAIGCLIFAVAASLIGHAGAAMSAPSAAEKEERLKRRIENGTATEDEEIAYHRIDTSGRY